MDMSVFNYYMDIVCWSTLVPFIGYHTYAVIKERIDNGTWLNPEFEIEAQKWGRN